VNVYGIEVYGIEVYGIEVSETPTGKEKKMF